MQITVVKVQNNHLAEVWKFSTFLKQRIMAKPRHTRARAHTHTHTLPPLHNSPKQEIQ